MKKFLLFVSALFLSFVYGEETWTDPVTNITWTYTLIGTDATITGSSQEGGTLTIPATVNNYPVTTIGDYAFSNKLELISIVLSGGITTINVYAFWGCSNLESIDIPASVISVGETSVGMVERPTFGDAPYLQIKVADENQIYKSVDGSLLSKDGTRLIRGVGHKDSSTYNVPDGVTRIDGWAFYNVSNLTKILLPDGVKTIGDRAFQGCSSLESINIPASVTAIGYENEWQQDLEVFSECSYVQIEVDEGNQTYKSVDGSLLSKDGTRLIRGAGYTDWYTYQVPDGVKTIDARAFSWCVNLTSITLPDGVETIGAYAFEFCSSLESVNIPASVTTIGYWNEWNQDLPVFFECSSLQIEVDKDNQTYKSVDGSLLSKNGERLICGAGNTELYTYQVPDGVKTIESYAFYNKFYLTSITLPESLMTIENDAFQVCWRLESITIPARVTTIGQYAFYGCRSLAKVTFLGEPPTSMGDSVFGQTKTGVVGEYPASKADLWEPFIVDGKWNELTMVPVVDFASASSSAQEVLFSSLVWDPALPESGAAQLTVVDGATIVIDAALSFDTLNIVCPGACTLQLAESSDISALTKIDVTGVTGALVLTQDVFDVVKGRLAAGAPVQMVKGLTLEEALLGIARVAVDVPDALKESFSVSINGEVQTGTFAIEDGVETFVLERGIPGNPKVLGTAWWWDYEFDGNVASIGTDTGVLTWDSDRPFLNEEYLEDATLEGNSFLRLPTRPWRGEPTSRGAETVFPTELTAIMRCQASSVPNAALISFGSSAYSIPTAITLATGENPEDGDMRLVLSIEKDQVIDLVENLKVPQATTAPHIYAFSLEIINGETHIAIYVDGKRKAIYNHSSVINLGYGFQLGSVHGGCPDGIQRPLIDVAQNIGDGSTVDFLRVTDCTLSLASLQAIADAYPYISPTGLATREVSGGEVLWEEDGAWTQTAFDQTVTTPAAPNSDTNVTFTAQADTTVDLNVSEAMAYESLTVAGPGNVVFTAEEVVGTVADVTVRTNVTFPAGKIELGSVFVGAGKRLTFDTTELLNRSFVSTTIPLTGLVTLEPGAEFMAYPETDYSGRRAALVYDDATESYVLEVTMPAGGMVAQVPDGESLWTDPIWYEKVDGDGKLSIQPVGENPYLRINLSTTLPTLTIEEGDAQLFIENEEGCALTLTDCLIVNGTLMTEMGTLTAPLVVLNGYWQLLNQGSITGGEFILPGEDLSAYAHLMLPAMRGNGNLSLWGFGDGGFVLKQSIFEPRVYMGQSTTLCVLQEPETPMNVSMELGAHLAVLTSLNKVENTWNFYEGGTLNRLKLTLGEGCTFAGTINLYNPQNGITIEGEPRFNGPLNIHLAGGIESACIFRTPYTIDTAQATVYYDNEASQAYQFVTEEDGLYVALGHRVTFDLGSHGVHAGGGRLVQIVRPGESAVAPTVDVAPGYAFEGWSVAFDAVTANLTVEALYSVLQPDLYVTNVQAPVALLSGDSLTVTWTTENIGTDSFNGRMTERVRLVSRADASVVHPLGTLTFSGALTKDAPLQRECSYTVPLKGWEGEWNVEVETALSPSVSEVGGNNVTQASSPLTITRAPLPDLTVTNLAVPTEVRPNGSATLSYTVHNVGEAELTTPWVERVWLQPAADATNAVLLSSVTVRESLAVGASTSRTVVVPIASTLALQGDVRFRVEVNTTGSVIEEDNHQTNTILAEMDTRLIQSLTIKVPSTSVRENVTPATINGTIVRSGPTSTALTVTLASDRADIVVPETVTLPVGASRANFTLTVVDNLLVDGDREVKLTFSAEGFEGATQILSVLDDEVPTLSVTLAATVMEGETVTGLVTRDLVTDQALTVYLSGPSTAQCSYPISVTIAANEASASFALQAVENTTQEIDVEQTLRANAIGFNAGMTTFMVADNDVPGVTLTLVPAEVSEGAGAYATYATLTRVDAATLDQAITVRLKASMDNQLIVPETIEIPRNTMLTRFAIGTVDNATVDGERTVVLDGAIVIESCNCDGQPSTGGAITATVIIHDDDSAALKVVADPATMKEGEEVAGSLTVSHNTTLTEALVVSLTHVPGDEIEIPETVTIPVGESSVQVPVKTLDDGEEDGSQLVSVEVTASDYVKGTTWLMVSDQNLPDLEVPAVRIDSPTLIAGDVAKVTFDLANKGFLECQRAVSYNVYVVQGETTTIEESMLVTSGEFTGGLAVDAVASVALDVKLPTHPADYRIAIKVDPNALINELNDVNNTGWSEKISLNPSYTATATVEGEIFLQGEPITITGAVIGVDGVTPMAGVAIDVYVIVDGIRRTLTAMTDAQGMYVATFIPLAGEAGHYTVGACYPGMNSKVEQDSFDILGMARVNTDHVIWDVTLGDEVSNVIDIRNLAPIELTGLQVEAVDWPEAFTFAYTLPEVLSGNGLATLEVTAIAQGVSEGTDYAKAYVRITSAEGVTLEIPLYLYSQSQQALLKATPASLQTTMAVGETRYVEFTLLNAGQGESGPVTVTAPSADWLRIVGGSTIETLKNNESAVVTIELTPTASLALNNPVTGCFAVNCENGTGITLPFTFTPVSDANGKIRVDVTDEYTYYLAEAPHVSGASITVTNPYTGDVVATGVTGDEGTWTSSDLPEGKYNVAVSATKHGSYIETVTVNPSDTTFLSVFLQFQAITADWKVERTEVEDQYDIRLELEYEVNVPAPVIKMEFPEELPELSAGESYAFNVVLENVGLLAAHNVSLNFPEIEGYTFSTPHLSSVINASETLVIPVVFSRSQVRKASRGITKRPCVYPATAGGFYWCGPEEQETSTTTSVRHGTCYDITAPGFGGGGGGGGGGGFGPGGGSGPSRDPVIIIGPEIITGPETVYEKTGCHPCAKFVSEALLALGEIGVELAKNQLSEGLKKIRDEILDKMPFMSCVKALVNSLSMIPSVGDKVDEFQKKVVILEGYFGSYGAQPLWKGATDAVVDYGSCAIEVGANILSGGGATAAKVAIATAKIVDSAKKWSEYAEEINKLYETGYKIGDIVAKRDLLRLFKECWGSIFRAKSSAGDNVQFMLRDYTVFMYGVEATQDIYTQFFDLNGEGANDFGDLTYIDLIRIYAFVMQYDGGEIDKQLHPSDFPEELARLITREGLERFCARYNKSKKNWLENVTNTSDEINFRKITENIVRISDAHNFAVECGYEDLLDMGVHAVSNMVTYMEQNADAVCASVSLKLSQTATMTREAFDGTLTLFNGHETIPMTNIKLDLSVTDEAGNLCTHLFGITPNGLETMMGSSIVVGDVELAPGDTGTAKILFVPSRDAAPEVATVYYFGGTLSYTDPFSGETATMKLTAVPLTVNPSPYLKVDYFVQRDVYGDNPFTTDVIEPSLPAEVSALIRNNGYGTAKQVMIQSAKPEIFENEKGLQMDFDLKDYTLDATALNGAPSQLGLKNVNLGDIQPYESAVAQWWFSSTLQGHFVGMTASFSQRNTWGNQEANMSLVESVNVHELIRSVTVDEDDLPDFLISESNTEDLPDTIMTSQGDLIEVHAIAQVEYSQIPSGATVTLPLTVTTEMPGWQYVSAPDLGKGAYTIVSVAREDGTLLPERNVWLTDRTFRDGMDTLIEDRIHLVDVIATAGTYTYTVTLQAKPTGVPVVEAFEGIEEGSYLRTLPESVIVCFEKAIDANSFTTADLMLRHQGELCDVTALTITPIDARSFRIGNLPVAKDEEGRYELTVHTIGITDPSGLPGEFGKSLVWSYVDATRPILERFMGLPERKRVKQLESLVVVFSEAINPDTFTPDKLSLALPEQAYFSLLSEPTALTITPMDDSNQRFEIGGLSGATSSDGTYTLTVDTTLLQSAAGVAGITAHTETWTIDTVAPTIVEMVYDNGEILMTFSEEVYEGSVTAIGVSVTRDGASVDVPVTLFALSATQYRVSVDAQEDGVYVLSYDATTVKDLAGNNGEGTKDVVWTVDTVAPEQLEDLAISPDTGSSATDGKTSIATVMVTATLPEEGLTVALLTETFGVESLLKTVLTTDLQLSEEITLPNGNTTLIARCTDAFGNTADTTLPVFVDTLTPSVTVSDLPTSNEECVTALTLTFSAPVNVTKEALALTCDGRSVELDMATLQAVSETDYRLAQLPIEDAGTYVLAIDLSKVEKTLTGLRGASIVEATWTYVPSDDVAPEVTQLLINGMPPEDVYAKPLTEIQVTFSEAMNVPTLLENGTLGAALRLTVVAPETQLNIVVEPTAKTVTWDAETNTLTWNLVDSLQPFGSAMLILEPLLLRDLAGNVLRATEVNALTTPGLPMYDAPTTLAVVNAYAIPSWYDVNGDGCGDLVVGETINGEGKIRVYLNTGSATAPQFGSYTYLQAGEEDVAVPAPQCQGASVCFIDWDGDGLDDLVVGQSDGTVALARASAYGTFEPLTTLWSSPTARATVSAVDVEQDGVEELIVGGVDGKMTILRRDGTTTLLLDKSGVPITVAAGRSTPNICDLNEDGRSEIVSGDSSGNLWLYLSEATSALRWRTTPIKLHAGTSDRSRACVADVNGDGLSDILVGDHGGNVNVLFGQMTMPVGAAFTLEATNITLPLPPTTGDGENLLDATTQAAFDEKLLALAVEQACGTISAIRLLHMDGRPLANEKTSDAYQAALLFDNVLSVQKDDGTSTGVICYDFGIERILPREVTGAEGSYVQLILVATVQNHLTANTATFAPTTEVVVLENNVPLATAVALTLKEVKALKLCDEALQALPKNKKWFVLPLKGSMMELGIKAQQHTN